MGAFRGEKCCGRQGGGVGLSSPGRAALGSSLWDRWGVVAIGGPLRYPIELNRTFWSEADISKPTLEIRCLSVTTRVTGWHSR